MYYLNKLLIILISTCLVLGTVQANENGEREELLGIKNTILNLIDELVGAGVLEEDKADLMKQRAEAKAKLQAAEEAEAAAEAKAEQEQADQDAVRVQYVPEHVKQEIRNSVRAELKQEVVDSVMADAKQEILGVPDLIPDWMKKIRISGDIRIRNQTDGYADDNVFDADNDGFRDVDPDFLALNADQQNIATAAVTSQDPNEYFEERDKSRNRFREQFRLGLDTEITTGLKFGMRLTTGNINDPISTNQSLGNDGKRFDVQLDRVFLQYTSLNEDAYPWLTVWGGRFKNPFFSTDMVFDKDLSFEGFALRFKKNLAGGNSLLDIEDDSKTFFATIGAFPLDEIEMTSQDKWMIGGQMGSELIFDDQSRFKFAISYYDYINSRGKRNIAQNGAGTRITFQEYDYTASSFLQGGNTMFDIRNDFDTVTPTIPIDTALYALAPDYNLLNITAGYDWAGLAPVHLIFTGDVVYNVGYDKKDILRRIAEGGNGIAQVYQDQILTDPSSQLTEETLGYSLKLTAGWPSVMVRGRWQVFGGYKYLQRDAVLDAFTDSDFHLGGTNAKGFIIGAKYGVLDNTWIRGRWLSTDTITGPDIGIDVLQLDLNAKF